MLGQKNFELYWSSLLVSAIGDQIANVTIAWQIYEITRSPLQLGLTGLFRALPILIFSLGGGLLADRVSRRKVLIGTQSAGMALTLMLGFLTSTGLVRVWHIYLIAFCAGIANTFDQPARSALVTSLVEREHLATAFGMSVTLRQSASLAGPFLGRHDHRRLRRERGLLDQCRELRRRDRLPGVDENTRRIGAAKE